MPFSNLFFFFKLNNDLFTKRKKGEVKKWNQIVNEFQVEVNPKWIF